MRARACRVLLGRYARGGPRRVGSAAKRAHSAVEAAIPVTLVVDFRALQAAIVVAVVEIQAFRASCVNPRETVHPRRLRGDFHQSHFTMGVNIGVACMCVVSVTKRLESQEFVPSGSVLIDCASVITLVESQRTCVQNDARVENCTESASRGPVYSSRGAPAINHTNRLCERKGAGASY